MGGMGFVPIPSARHQPIDSMMPSILRPPCIDGNSIGWPVASRKAATVVFVPSPTGVDRYAICSA